MSLEADFLDHSVQRLEQFFGRIETCIGKLNAEQIWMRGGENQNAIGNLVLHLAGNVRQWILSGVGGAGDSRDRDQEFAARGGMEPAELLRLLRATVQDAVAVLRSLPHERLTERRVIQGYDVTVLEAIYSVVEHFSGHTAQIVFVTKMLTGEDLGFYRYLSMPQSHSRRVP
jgi:uncharacterized damage-inducible protein DinB